MSTIEETFESKGREYAEFPSTDESDPLNSDRKRTRQEVIQDYLEHWKPELERTFNVKFTYIDDAAQLITELYFRYVDEYIKPMLENNKSLIQVYKIAANTELSILRISPIQYEDEKIEKDLNSYLAFNIALSIIVDWFNLDRSKLIEIKESNKELQEFIAEHIIWLIHLDPKFYYPVFSNSQVWRLFYYFLRDNLNK